MKAINISDLKIASMVALLGRISSDVRLIKVHFDGGVIRFSAVISPNADDEVIDLLSEAGSEIIAAFPELRIIEDFRLNAEPLPKEDVVSEGWIYQRAE